MKIRTHHYNSCLHVITMITMITMIAGAVRGARAVINNIAVKGGIATLAGSADRLSEFEPATANACEGGARNVINNPKTN